VELVIASANLHGLDSIGLHLLYRAATEIHTDLLSPSGRRDGQEIDLAMVAPVFNSPCNVANYFSVNYCNGDESLVLRIVKCGNLVVIILDPSTLLVLKKLVPEEWMNEVLEVRTECFNSEVDQGWEV
jgi:hypothetical protein